jgi:pyruvate/2-oxoglutarate/acetoin dehydrogenase E1 component/TPP-dependent pyruvate/acetoin dehydrogenase alpha subunit
MAKISSSLLFEAFEKMVTIRTFEDEIAKKFRDGSFPRHAHTYQGQEAIAVGVCLALHKGDLITSTHRGHGHLIAKGGDLCRIVAEFAGKAKGYCKGKGGEMHVVDPEIGLLGAISIVGGGIPLAVGSGLASQILHDGRVTVCFFGEGASNQGTFHEGLNLAAAWKLGAVFVCENNLYAMTVRSSEVTSVENIATRAQAYGIPGITVDGTNIVDVYEATASAVTRARAGEGPTLIECKTFRFEPHATVFPPSLHPAAKNEIEEWRRRDPIEQLYSELAAEKLITADHRRDIYREAQVKVQNAILFALNEAWPEVSEAAEDVFAAPYIPTASLPDPGGRELTYVKALNEALREEMSRDDGVIVLGEDVELLGGLYGVTRDLSKLFPNRVKDTPISENTFAGTGIGAAVRGCRAVVELMYMDFTALAMDQIVNLAAKLHYMTGGQIKVPVVIRTATGAGGGGSATHSQSLEAWFCHVPGLKVAMPTTPYDAKGLLKTAIRDDNPVLFLEHKLLYQTKGPVPEGDYAIPFGLATTRRKGKDITVVATGAMVIEALKAAEELWKESGIELEVIDPRTLVPLDLESIISSVKKTRKAIIFNEAPCRGSFGADVAAQVAEFAFDWLDAPVMTVGLPHTPIPFSPVLERNLIPNAARLLSAVSEMLGE